MLRILLAGSLVVSLLGGCAAPGPRLTERVEAPATARLETAPKLADAGEDLLYLLLAGEFLLQQGEVAAAAPLYVAAARLSPESAVAERAARVAFFAGADAEALAALRRWQELAPGDDGPLQMEAALLLRADDPDAAMPLLLRLLQQPDGWRLVAQALVSQGQRTRALDLLAMLGGHPAVQQDLDAVLAFSQLAAQFGEPVLAARLADVAIERFSDQVQAWIWHAQLAESQRRYEEAERSFRRALALEPGEVSLRVAYAGLLHELGRTRQALALLDSAPDGDQVLAARFALAASLEDPEVLDRLRREIVESPQSMDARRQLMLGQISELLEDWDGAEAWYLRIAPDSPVYAEAQIRRAVVLARRDQLEAALQLLRRERDRPGLDASALSRGYLLEAELLTEVGRLEEAWQVYAEGLARLPDDQRLLYARGLLSERLDRLDAAEQDFRRLLLIDPDDGHALNALGYTLADRTDRYDEALGYITRALELLPDSAAVIDSKGWVLFRLGRLEEAEQWLRRAWEMERDGEIGAHLGEALHALGRIEEALAVWRDALEADPDSKPLLRTLERLAPGLLP